MYFLTNEEGNEVQKMMNLPTVRQWILRQRWFAASSKLKPLGGQ